MIRPKEIKKIVETAKLAEQKLLQDLSRKVAQGEAGVAEARQIRKMIDEFEEREQAGKFEGWIMPTRMIAEFYDVTVRAIQMWFTNQEPPCPRVKYGWWNLKDVNRWYLENIYEYASDRQDETFREHRRLREKYNAELARIKVEKEKELLTPTADILEMWCQRVAEIKAGCFALENRLPGILEGKSQGEMREIIAQEIWDLFDNFSRNGKFTPKHLTTEAL